MGIGRLILNIGKETVKGAVGEVGRAKHDDIKHVAINALGDAIESMVAGRRSLEEWCGIASKPVDDAIANTVSADGVKFVGGYLSFSFADPNMNKVVIAYELYFIDEKEKWKKQNAHSDVYASNFTQNALDEIASKGTVKFDVEE